MILETVLERSHIRIKGQICLFYIAKDLAHKIKDSRKEKDLDIGKYMIKFMIFQSGKNLVNPRENCGPTARIIIGEHENEIIDIMLEKITSLYSDDAIISNFLSLQKRLRKEAFLYLYDPKVEKNSNKAEYHLPILS